MTRTLTAAALLLIGCSGGGPTNELPTPALTACLDRPTELSRPPTRELPCELIPPPLKLDRAQPTSRRGTTAR